MATSEQDNKNAEVLASQSPPDNEGAKERILAKAEQAEVQEKAELHNLVEQAMGLKAKDTKPDADLPPESIEHIKTHQIKSMRKASAERINEKEPITDQLSQLLIKVFCGIGSLFTVGKSKDHCIVKGHECMHCGQKIAFTGTESIEKR